MSIAPMQVLNGGEKFPSNLRWPKEKVVEYPRRFRGYPHPIKALNDCQETLKEYFKVSRNLIQR